VAHLAVGLIEKRLPARRHDAFKKAKRESGKGQGLPDL